MTEQRKGEIALLLLKRKFLVEEFTGENARENIAETADEIGIKYSEAAEFIEEMIRELCEKTISIIKLGRRIKLGKPAPEDQKRHGRSAYSIEPPSPRLHDDL